MKNSSDLNTRSLAIAVIDDDEDDFFLIKELLATTSHLTWLQTVAEGRKALNDENYDAYLLDYRLGEVTGLELLTETTHSQTRGPVILLTGGGDTETDKQALQLGAADYINKSELSATLLDRSIRYAIYRNQMLQNMKSLLDSTFEGILVYNSEGIILESNRAAEEIFGYSRQYILGKSFFDLCKVEQKKIDLQLSQAHETIGTKKDQTNIFLEVYTKTYIHQNSQAYLSTVRDITQRKQMEAQLLMQDRLASVGLLASGLAHEIGTPLGVIRGRAEMIQQMAGSNSTLEKNIDIIVSQIDRVTKLIKSLLTLARGDSLNATVSVSLIDTLNQVIELLAHEFKVNHIVFESKLEQGKPVKVKADNEQLQQVLLNLLVNACHAIESKTKQTNPSDFQPRISFKEVFSSQNFSTTKEPFRKREFWIEDNGCGISKDNLKNLFKPFFTTKEVGVGTGLGLANCYRMIHTWGGHIELESTEGVGTTVKLTLLSATD